ncbi:hypothetical protein HDV03_005417 [Kappamyces sp. JEL0829]|nr:hypothetical protein HDV03_005417 [Kappamyces sp. JEL0829]
MTFTMYKQDDPKYQGPRAERFKTLPPVTGDIGPGCYDLNETDLTNQMMKKPTSKLGVAVVKSIRFPTIPNSVPGAGTYDGPTFIDILGRHYISKKGTLSNVSKEKFANMQLTKNSCYYSPGPGIYNINYAVGRHVANDYSFALYKSEALKKRDRINAEQMANLKELVGKDDIFTDRKACRRMAYLSLYYPLHK